MRLAFTADLHWGHDDSADELTRLLAARVRDLEPDALILAGDIGTGRHFRACLQAFHEVAAPRLCVPGNHDLWTDGPAPASLSLYQEGLPQQAATLGFQMLDHAPWVAPDGTVAVVGSINWYDYSFADPSLEEQFPGMGELYPAKLFPGGSGRHNDGRFVKLGMSDEEFTGMLVEGFRRQMAALPSDVRQVIVVQHHPPVRELFYPLPARTPAQKTWYAYTGNRRMHQAVQDDPRVSHLVCGHTHARMAADVGPRRGLNIGGDYGWKSLLLLDTETGEEAWEDFRPAGAVSA